MRSAVIAVFAVGLAACTPSVPDSGAGVGFQDYNSYLRERELGASRPAATPVTPLPAPSPGFSPAGAAAAIDRATGVASLPATPPTTLPPTGAMIGAPIDGLVTGTRPRGNAPAGIREETGEMVHSNPAISDEQDFDAVASRETIESDKARIDRNRSQYQVVQPGVLPVRPGETGPNIVDYALATTHPVGTQLHRRSGFGVRNSAAACARFASPDLAQAEFLARGGPDRDRLGLDPDGDGYACSWDPRPFRAALQR